MADAAESKAEHAKLKEGRHRGKADAAAKDDRRPHSYMKNRGRTKKGGGGGKHTWGKPGDELLPYTMDPRDPNYDSEEDPDAYVLVSRYDRESSKASKVGVPLASAGAHGYREAADTTVREYGDDSAASRRRVADASVRVNLSTFKKRVVPIIKEYFESEDTEEVARAVEEIRAPFFHYELVKRAVTMSLGKKDRERELVSKLLSALYPRVLTMEQTGKGFERLFEVSDDLELDTPNARKLLARFVGRAIVDEVLPPSFLSDRLVEDIGGSIVDEAKVLLSMKHGTARLEHVWAPGADAPLEELKNQIRLLVEEYYLSEDAAEAVRCLRELNVPHFHHEVVKRTIVLATDKTAREQGLGSKLIAYFTSEEVVSGSQMSMGFDRVKKELSDLCLDNPSAETVFNTFVSSAVEAGALPTGWNGHVVEEPEATAAAGDAEATTAAAGTDAAATSAE